MILIRKVLPCDLDQLSLLFQGYRLFYNQVPDYEKETQFLAQRLQNNDSEIFVAQTANNMLAGFVQLYPLFSSTRLKRLWLLNDLYVAPEYRGQHISIKLIDAAKQLTKQTEACGLLLETAKTNLIGNQLYQNTGFQLDKDHHYYSWDA